MNIKNSTTGIRRTAVIVLLSTVALALTLAMSVLEGAESVNARPAVLADSDGARSYDFESAAAYSEKAVGHAVVVAIGGQVVFERYAGGWSASRPHRLASGTKSFSGVLAMMMVQEGLLRLDEKVADTITEWKTDRRKSRITFRQLLTLTSGILGGRPIPPPSYAQSIHAPTIAEPGTVFSYGPNPYQIFGEAMKRKLAPRKMTVSQYLQKKLIDPLEIKVGYWMGFANGEPLLPAGAYLTAREWAKFGEFLRQKGSYKGKKLLEPELLAECFKPTPVKPTYGMTFWLPQPDSPAGPGSASAKGKGKQRLYHLPLHDMTVIRFGETNSPAFSDDQFLALLLPRKRSRADGPRDPRGPYTHKICSASSEGGLEWNRDPGVRMEHASVPCAVAADDERILLYFVDADRGPGQFESVGCAVSTDGMNFQKTPFFIEGLPADKALDPCVVRDASGRFRLYYFGSTSIGLP